jgi:hypothetical protein
VEVCGFAVAEWTEGSPAGQAFHFRSNYSILFLAMPKRKPAKFSAAKAVKANARERVGQPKPSRIVADQPRTARDAKHKPKLEDLIRQED